MISIGSCWLGCILSRESQSQHSCQFGESMTTEALWLAIKPINAWFSQESIRGPTRAIDSNINNSFVNEDNAIQQWYGSIIMWLNNVIVLMVMRGKYNINFIKYYSVQEDEYIYGMWKVISE